MSAWGLTTQQKRSLDGAYNEHTSKVLNAETRVRLERPNGCALPNLSILSITRVLPFAAVNLSKTRSRAGLCMRVVGRDKRRVVQLGMR